MTRDEAARRWRLGNDRGEGYAPLDGVEEFRETVEALEADGWTVLHASHTDDEIAVLERNGEIIGVGDAHGAWAVTLNAVDE